jgi:hypothetical protein
VSSRYGAQQKSPRDLSGAEHWSKEEIVGFINKAIALLLENSAPPFINREGPIVSGIPFNDEIPFN